MTAFNAVRMRVKPGLEQEFLDAHKKLAANWPGLRRVSMIKFGERHYCIIAEWSGMAALAKARPNMIATLDTFRGKLEDLGGGLGVTDPVSGDVVFEMKRQGSTKARKKAAKKKAPKSKKPAGKKKAAKKTKRKSSERR